MAAAERQTQTHRVRSRVLVRGETEVSAAEGVGLIHDLRSTKRARAAGSACHRSQRRLRDGPSRRSTARRRARGRGRGQRAGGLTRLVKWRMVWNLQLHHGRTRVARRRHGKAVRFSSAQPSSRPPRAGRRKGGVGAGHEDADKAHAACCATRTFRGLGTISGRSSSLSPLPTSWIFYFRVTFLNSLW